MLLELYCRKAKRKKQCGREKGGRKKRESKRGRLRVEPISEDQQKEYKQVTSDNKSMGEPTKMHQTLGRSETLEEMYYSR